MKNSKLFQLLTMVIASSTMGARGLACIGNCHDYSESNIVPILPPSSGGDVGVTPSESTETLCNIHCPSAQYCSAATIKQPDGTTIPVLQCTSHFGCSAGRRPAGLTNLERNEPSAQGLWLSNAAYLEAASIDAFRLVRRDLRAFGAPRRLLRQASRAVCEEKRHTRRMRALAKRAGITHREPLVIKAPIPTLEQMATQNAVEGCVREAFGALVAQYQAIHARDREVAAAMKTIAMDEANHAALAYRIDAWARRRLGPDACARINAARDAAAQELLRDAAALNVATDRIALGLPDACTAYTLGHSMLEALQILPQDPKQN